MGDEKELKIISIKDVVDHLLKYRILNMLAIFLAIVLGVYNLFSYKPKYTATMSVAQQSQGADVSASSGLGSVTAILGIGVATQTNLTEFARLRAAIGSIQFAERMQRQHGLLQKIFESSWNEEDSTWSKPIGFRHMFREFFRNKLNFNIWRAPDEEILSEYLGSKVIFSEKKNSSIIKVYYENKDRKLAYFVLDTVVRGVDALVREENVILNNEKIKYLKGKIRDEVNIELKNTLFILLGNEIKKSMLLDSGESYSFRYIQRPYVSNRKTEPNLLRLFILPIVICVFVLITISFFTVILNSELFVKKNEK